MRDYEPKKRHPVDSKEKQKREVLKSDAALQSRLGGIWEFSWKKKGTPTSEIETEINQWKRNDR
jgi:hypothetical protein